MPPRLIARVCEWYRARGWLDVRVRLYMMRGGAAKLHTYLPGAHIVRPQVLVDESMAIDEDLRDVELRAYVKITQQVPGELARRVLDWYRKKRWKQVRVKLSMVDDHTARLMVWRPPSRAMLDERIGVDEEPRDVELRAKALAALARRA